MTDPSGLWTLSEESGAHSILLALPGNATSARRRAGVIPDPCRGRNEDGLRRIAACDWVAVRRFDPDGTPADLAVDGPDKVAGMTPNGRPVLSAANVFRRYRAGAAGLRAGRNEIRILFRSNLRAADALQAALPFRLPCHDGGCPHANGNMLHKVQCDFGWDRNLAGAPFGPCGRIALAPKGPRNDDMRMTRTDADGAVTMRADVDTDYEKIRATFCICDVKAKSAGGVARLAFRITAPGLWWPAGLGAQVPHDPAITAGTATARRRIGLRRRDLASQADAAGQSFGFRINGHTVPARGPNRTPADALGADEVRAFDRQGADGTAPGRDIHAPQPWRGHDLKTPKITHRIPAAPGDWAIGMTAGHPASFVVSQADRLGRFWHNALALMPGQDAPITFVPEAPHPAPRVTVRDLHSAPHGAPTAGVLNAVLSALLVAQFPAAWRHAGDAGQAWL